MNQMKAMLCMVLGLCMLVACSAKEEELDIAPEVPTLSNGAPVDYTLLNDGIEDEPLTQEGENSSTEGDDNGKIVISMVGDCTLASSQHDNYFDKTVGDDYSYPFAKVLSVLGGDDFTIANLEGSFSDKTLYGNGTFYFCAPTAYAKILTEGSVDLATMGNNHTDEFGETGVEDTKAALDAENISHLYANEGTIYHVNGLKLGVYVSKYLPSADAVKKGVEKLKSDGADVIIACIHWGQEGKYDPNSSQISVAHAAINAGADVICGTHPHVLQKMEEYNGGYIFYSLGNFSFGGNTNPRDKDTAIAQVIVEKDENGKYYVSGVEAIPCSLSGESNKNNFQPVLLEEGTEAYDRVMSKLDGTFDGPDLTIDYSAFNGSETSSTPKPTATAAPSSGDNGNSSGADSSGDTSSGDSSGGGSSGGSSESNGGSSGENSDTGSSDGSSSEAAPPAAEEAA